MESFTRAMPSMSRSGRFKKHQITDCRGKKKKKDRGDCPEDEDYMVN